MLSNYFQSDYFKVGKRGISPFETLTAYLAGSAFQTIIDNPVTAYRQLVQQYAKDLKGNTVDPKIARIEANNVFKKSPISASLSGLGPRLVGVGIKRVPKFGFFLGTSYLFPQFGEEGLVAATLASVFSAPFINPVRMIEKQQRAYFRQTGKAKSVYSILSESARDNFKPLFRGTTPLIGHSFASASTGLVGQPVLEKYIKDQLNLKAGVSGLAASLVASSIVSPIYVIMTNPLARLEVIMQSAEIKGKPVSLVEAGKEIIHDSKKFGLRGMFRGQMIGIVKAVISLTTFHQGRQYATNYFIDKNRMEE